MQHSYWYVVVALLFLAGCIGAQNIYRESPVAVESLTLGPFQREPARTVVTLKGQAGICERLDTRQRLEGKTFYLSVIGIHEGPADRECAAVVEAYMQTVELMFFGLEPGLYTVKAGALAKTFNVPPADVSEALVDAVEVALLESDPVQVVVTANGYLRSGCQEIGEVSQHFESDTFFVTISAMSPWGGACPPIAPPFTERVTLETQNLPPGTYEVDVNGVVKTFTLP